MSPAQNLITVANESNLKEESPDTESNGLKPDALKPDEYGIPRGLEPQ